LGQKQTEKFIKKIKINRNFLSIPSVPMTQLMTLPSSPPKKSSTFPASRRSRFFFIYFATEHPKLSPGYITCQMLSTGKPDNESNLTFSGELQVLSLPHQSEYLVSDRIIKIRDF